MVDLEKEDYKNLESNSKFLVTIYTLLQLMNWIFSKVEF